MFVVYIVSNGVISSREKKSEQGEICIIPDLNACLSKPYESLTKHQQARVRQSWALSLIEMGLSEKSVCESIGIARGTVYKLKHKDHTIRKSVYDLKDRLKDYNKLILQAKLNRIISHIDVGNINRMPLNKRMRMLSMLVDINDSITNDTPLKNRELWRVK